MQFKILGIPIFRYANIKKPHYKGMKIVLFGILLFTAGIGHEEGYHHHISLVLLNLEIFLGISMKDQVMP